MREKTFVDEWLWRERPRRTHGMPWTDEYIADAARMCHDYAASMRADTIEEAARICDEQVAHYKRREAAGIGGYSDARRTEAAVLADSIRALAKS